MGYSTMLRASTVALLAAVPACQDAPRRPPLAAPVRDSAGITIIANTAVADAPWCRLDSAPRVAIGSAVGDPAYELYRVRGAVRLSDGGIVVLNAGTAEVRSYSPDGQFVRSVGHSGEGPQELSDPSWLWRLPGDSLWVADANPWAMLVFSPAGAWVRTITTQPLLRHPVQAAGVLADGSFVLGITDLSSLEARGAGESETQELDVVRYEGTGLLVDTLAVVPFARFEPLDPQGHRWVPPLFQAAARLAVGFQRVLLSSSDGSPEVRAMDPDGNLTRIVRWDVADRRVRDADVDAERKRIRDLLETRRPNRERAANLTLSLDADRRVAELFPTLGALLVGDDGRMWVKEYARPTDSERDRWLMFDSEGQLQCRLRTPSGLQVTEFGGDYLLGVGRDEADAERVLLYQFTLPVGSGTERRVRSN